MYRILFLLLAAYDYVPEGSWQMRFQGGSGAWSAWAAVGEPFGSRGDNRVTISDLASAHNVIAVGSHTTKLAWTDILGRRHTEDGELQSLSAFSSRGPTRDGRPKPDLTAPGEWIVSARSVSAAWPTEWVTSQAHVAAAGTSMSAPIVTGAAALVMSRPEGAGMDAIALRELLTDSARRDQNTGADRNDDWGAGKLDAHAALELAGASSGQPATATPTATPTPVTPPVREPTNTPPSPTPTRVGAGGTATLFLPVARR
jgi:subtilisin family serine protease